MTLDIIREEMLTCGLKMGGRVAIGGNKKGMK